MKYVLNCSPKEIEGYQGLIDLNRREINPFYVRMTRLTFNLRTVSFELVEVPRVEVGFEKMSPDLIQDNARVIKIRCVYPSVTFDELAHCLPSFNEIRFYEQNDGLIVELEKYAQIHCSKAIVRVEKCVAEDYSVWSLGL